MWSEKVHTDCRHEETAPRRQRKQPWTHAESGKEDDPEKRDTVENEGDAPCRLLPEMDGNRAGSETLICVHVVEITEHRIGEDMQQQESSDGYQ